MLQTHHLVIITRWIGYSPRLHNILDICPKYLEILHWSVQNSCVSLPNNKETHQYVSHKSYIEQNLRGKKKAGKVKSGVKLTLYSDGVKSLPKKLNYYTRIWSMIYCVHQLVILFILWGCTLNACTHISNTVKFRYKDRSAIGDLWGDYFCPKHLI